MFLSLDFYNCSCDFSGLSIYLSPRDATSVVPTNTSGVDHCDTAKMASLCRGKHAWGLRAAGALLQGARDPT